MSAFLSDIHFWTTQEDILIKETDYGSFKYYQKKESCLSSNALAKRTFCEQSGITSIPNNKRPDKLRERLKELEEYLLLNKIVYYSWDDTKLKILMSTGLIVNLTINYKTGDLTNITFDKQLFLKLQVNIISDGTIFGSQVICVCNDGHVLGFGAPWKDGWVLDGGPRRRLHYHNDWLVVYGKSEVEHPQPWSPLTKDHQRANLHLYWIGCRDPELLAYRKTDGEPLLIIVSKVCSRTVIVVEQKVSQKGAVSVEVSNFELIGNTLKRMSITSVPLQTQVSCSALSESEERLLIGCIDGSLAILDRNRGSTRIVKAAFIATLAAWHPEGVIVAVANEKGYIQYYDTALNAIKSQLTSEDYTPAALLDLSGYFNTQFNVVSLNWGPKDLIISFEQGPLAILIHTEGSLSFKAVSQRYLTSGKIEQAVRLLLSWDFSDKVYFVLHQITMQLLRKPLTQDVAQYLQEALGSFHNSPTPLPSQIRHKFGHQVMCITRRFFHQLVRTGMFETAFLLAVDVGHHDLFMDLHYIAVKLGETEMAAAARAQASALLSRCSSEASNCSRSLCSQCSDSESCSSTTNYEENVKTSATKADSENVMTTDFMQPTTCKIEEIEDRYSEIPRKPCPPRATYVKAPQVPSDFRNPIQAAPSVPPLPFYRSLGVSYIQQYVENISQKNRITSSGDLPTNQDMDHNISGLPHLNSFNLFKSSTHNYMPLSKESPPLPRVSNMSSKLSKSCHNLESACKTFPPPPKFLNVQNHTSFDNLIDFDEPITSKVSRKVTTKVKFSDTVTAFIVPEVKRSVKPPLPSHITDPQRELAESLPLCHPNEDYLKDFTPVRKDGEGGNSSEASAPPKIKVVHFGVV
ncbi:WD repeat-containing and planar cell polarity effector protein fritz [Euwallacea similis]|uniref:WD repeat-containing and planar cell polarity effector protein fritz n=1 Tax=Euwallacea similis TaxID=1736056 RepID=UPI00344CCD06